MIRIHCNKADAILRETETLTDGMLSYPSVQFTFSDEWNGMGKLASCRVNNTFIDNIVLTDNSFVIPPECFAEHGYVLSIGVHGSDGVKAINTVWCSVGMIEDGVDYDDASNHEEPTPSDVDQMLGYAGQCAEYLEETVKNIIRTVETDDSLANAFGTAEVDFTDSGEGTNRTIKFTFKNLKGNGLDVFAIDDDGTIRFELSDGTSVEYEDLKDALIALAELISDVENAEATRTSQEASRVSAETGRVNAENARVIAEEDREDAEDARAEAETARDTAEGERETAETGRVSAESARVSAESARVTAENSRVSAETARASAESARASAETTRAGNETSRVSAETARSSAESARATAESARATAESGRVTAEAARVSAEEERAEEFATWEATIAAKADQADLDAEVTRATAAETQQSQQIDGKISEPAADGTAGQVLATDGAGTRYWKTVSGGGGGTSDYTDLTNKPKINNVELSGNKTASALGFADVATSGSYNDLTDKPTIPTVPTSLSQLSEDSTHRTVTDTEKSTWNGKGTYSKPSGGIPKTDLATAVQSSLGKADSALQASDITGKENTENKVTTLSASSTDTEYPSAKCVYDIVGDVESLLEALL